MSDCHDLGCQPHGELHDAMECLRQLAKEASKSGRWTADTDSCDCGDGYGCSHGAWVHGVHMADTHRDDKPCDPDSRLDRYRHVRSELSEFTWDEGQYVVAAQPSVVLGLLDSLDRARAIAAALEAQVAAVEELAAEWERDGLPASASMLFLQIRAALHPEDRDA